MSDYNIAIKYLNDKYGEFQFRREGEKIEDKEDRTLFLLCAQSQLSIVAKKELSEYLLLMGITPPKPTKND